MHSSVRVVNNKGERGGVKMDAAATIPGNFEAIFAHNDSVVDIVSTKITGTMTGVAIPKGSYYLCPCTSVTFVSGSITVYNSDMA